MASNQNSSRLVSALGWLGITCVVIIVAICFGESAQAAGRGYSAPSRGYSAPRHTPRPAPTVTRNTTVNKTIVNRTTVIQQRNHSAPSSGSGAGSSFLSGAAGAFTGSMIGSWLFAPKPQEQPQQPPQEVAPEAPVAPVAPQCDSTLYDCTPKVPK